MAALSVDFGIKMDRSALARIENHERGLYDCELLALSKILRVALDQLFEENDGENHHENESSSGK